MFTRTLVIAAVAVLVSAGAAAAGVVGTPHDLSTAGVAIRGTSNEACIYCHTPHNGSNAGAPLWNRATPGSTYTMYNSTYSATMDMVVGADVGAVSKACLSCHDGSISLGALLNVNGAAANLTMSPQGSALATYSSGSMTGGSPFIGTDLRSDHPVAITYNNTLDTAFVAAAAGKVGALPLYGASKNQVECATCHDPHNNTYGNFLRISNSASAMCTTCHVK